MPTHKEIDYPAGHRSRFTNKTPQERANDLIMASEPEKSLQDTVTKMAKALGWRLYHTYRSEKSEPGYPDLCMVRDGRLIFAELKVVGKAPTMEQVRWLLDLARVPGVEVYAWDALDIVAIERILT